MGEGGKEGNDTFFRGDLHFQINAYIMREISFVYSVSTVFKYV